MGRRLTPKTAPHIGSPRAHPSVTSQLRIICCIVRKVFVLKCWWMVNNPLHSLKFHQPEFSLQQTDALTMRTSICIICSIRLVFCVERLYQLGGSSTPTVAALHFTPSRERACSVVSKHNGNCDVSYRICTHMDPEVFNTPDFWQPSASEPPNSSPEVLNVAFTVL